MVVVELKCQMCDARFEAEALDRQDPYERDRPGEVIRRIRPGGPMRPEAAMIQFR